jgi:hypothetical protein
MKKLSYTFILIIFICCINLNYCSTVLCNTENQTIEILLDGIDSRPLSLKIGELESINNTIELWHHSGKYWSYKGIKISDNLFGKDLGNEQKLEEAINEKITFEIPLEQSLYNKLKENKSIKIFCSSTLTTQKTNQNIPIDNLFYDKPIIEVKNNKMYFMAKPKLHFYNNKFIRFQEIVGDVFNVHIPIVDPDYGHNSYAIWKRTAKVDLGATDSYFDTSDPFAWAPADSFLISPAQIKNANGHLHDGFTFKTGEVLRNSEDCSVGYGTLKDGGAVGIRFLYPLKFTFYSDDEYPMDLSAHFETLPSSSVIGDPVQVCVKVKSNFETDINDVPFKWEITKSDGTALNEIKYSGTSDSPEGKINIPLQTQQAIFYADFVMPDSDVKIKFSVNSEGTTPSELYLENNSIDSGESIKLVNGIPYIGKFDLDYNVLSRDLSFPLADGAEIKAKLNLPRGEWIGPATGRLNINNSLAPIYNSFSTSSTNVNERSEEIILKPIINATLQRSDFNDNPLERKFKNLENPFEPVLKSANLTFRGSVSRSYKYYYNSTTVDELGNPITIRLSDTTSASASFNSGSDTRDIRTFIYNGRETMPSVAARTFKNIVENNGFKRNVFWTSDPYKFSVLRYMCHIDATNTPYKWTKVDGQYQRTFTQQNTANISWSVKNSMASLYNYDRKNAREMNYGKEYYPNAVFASDKSLQKFDWPIKSGYYFNPLGEYTCTVKTVQYKDTPDSTNEHTELVEKSKNSFHYTSNMLYTSNGKNYQHLDLHNGNDKIFGMDMLDITTTYDKADTKLEHFNNSAYADKTHQFFKEILEGYSESNTENSKTNFKYREYIKQGDIYKVEETTVITFRVSPKNQKLYTYINIKDGEYLINARIDNFTLNNYAYKGLTVNGLSSIDNITVNVEGTLYDDQNAIIR